MTTSFQTPGTHTVGVEATDDHGLSARTTVTVTVLEQAADELLRSGHRAPPA